MPELPEVEHVRRSLLKPLLGAHIVGVVIRRTDVADAWTPRGTSTATRADLLNNARVVAIHRHGKQLAFVAQDDRAMCVQLGMTGGMILCRGESELACLDHAHVVWQFAGAAPSPRPREGLLVFRDPRRFGGITCYPTFDSLRQHRWSALGPDALTIQPGELHAALSRTTRSIKAALLDQRVLAGVGNIYADEALFGARLSPRRRADRLTVIEVERLALNIRTVLDHAVQAGGSTIRDYRGSAGEEGTFQSRHLVYGRAGMPCLTCGTTLRRITLAQRTTVLCPRCQRSTPRGKPAHNHHLSTLGTGLLG